MFEGELDTSGPGFDQFISDEDKEAEESGPLSGNVPSGGALEAFMNKPQDGPQPPRG